MSKKDFNFIKIRKMNNQPSEQQVEDIIKETMKEFDIENTPEAVEKWTKFIMNQVVPQSYPENSEDDFSLEEQAVFSLLKKP